MPNEEQAAAVAAVADALAGCDRDAFRDQALDLTLGTDHRRAAAAHIAQRLRTFTKHSDVVELMLHDRIQEVFSASADCLPKARPELLANIVERQGNGQHRSSIDRVNTHLGAISVEDVEETLQHMQPAVLEVDARGLMVAPDWASIRAAADRVGTTVVIDVSSIADYLTAQLLPLPFAAAHYTMLDPSTVLGGPPSTLLFNHSDSAGDSDSVGVSYDAADGPIQLGVAAAFRASTTVVRREELAHARDVARSMQRALTDTAVSRIGISVPTLPTATDAVVADLAACMLSVQEMVDGLGEVGVRAEPGVRPGELVMHARSLSRLTDVDRGVAAVVDAVAVFASGITEPRVIADTADRIAVLR